MGAIEKILSSVFERLSPQEREMLEALKGTLSDNTQEITPLPTEAPEPPGEKPQAVKQTKKQLKARLDALGVPVPSRAKKAELERLVQEAEERARVTTGGQPCAGCGDPADAIPAKGEPGYHHKRLYGPACQERRAEEREAAKAEYQAQKAKRKQRRSATVEAIAQAQAAPEKLKPVPAGVKIQERGRMAGFPLVCEITGELVPTHVNGEVWNKVSTASPEAHEERKRLRAAGEPSPYSYSDLRAIRLTYQPVGVEHPQGDGSAKSRPERDTRGKRARKRKKVKADRIDVPVPEKASPVESPFPVDVAMALRVAPTPAARAVILRAWEEHGAEWYNALEAM